MRSGTPVGTVDPGNWYRTSLTFHGRNDAPVEPLRVILSDAELTRYARHIILKDVGARVSSAGNRRTCW